MIDKVLRYLHKATNIHDSTLVGQDLYFDHRNISIRNGLYLYWLDGYAYNDRDMGDYKFKASTAIKIMRLL